MAPKVDAILVKNEMEEENLVGESNSLLGERKNDSWVMLDAEEDNHPFNDEDSQAKMSLI